ncbi:MAG TPA: hypothetical protein VKE94_21670 [Gemmataceae bacterium]|nr:hypothetical protein [Gemmataceae bacterium]
MTSNPNGNGNKILWWLISLLTGGLVGLGSHTFTGNADHGSKIAVLEHQAAETEHRLQQIETKIDRLLEHQRR